MVRTVRRTILRFLTDLLMRCKLQPELRCAGCPQTRVHILTLDTCSLSSIRGRKPWQWTPRLVGCLASRRFSSRWYRRTERLCHALISLYLLGSTDNADPPASPQMRPFPPKREAENSHAVSHVLLFQFSPVPLKSSQVSTSQTKGSSNSTNSSQSMSSEAFWTPNTASSQFVELPEPGSRSQSSPN